jgi:hypothetical protein
MFWQPRNSVPSYRRQANRPAPVLVVQQVEDAMAYVLAKPAGTRWLIEAVGEWQPAQPLLSSDDLWSKFWTEGLAELSRTGVPWNGRKLLLCLRRPVIDFVSLRMADVEGVDLSEQVHNQMAIQERLEPDDLVIDYATYPTPVGGPRTVFVATLPRAVWENWESQLQATKLKPAAAIPRIWAITHLLSAMAAPLDQPTLLLALYRKQADLVVLVGGQPVFVRSLNLQQPDDPAAVAQQLVSEIRLTAGTIDLPGDDAVLAHAILVGDGEFIAGLADDLTQSLDLNPQTVAVERLPQFNWAANTPVTADVAPLLGTLLAFTKSPDLESIDLMNPKQIAKPVSRARLYGWAAALVGLGLSYWGFDLWQTYATDQQAIVEQAQKVKEARAALERTLPKARVADYLQRWENEKVDWLQQLAEITRRLPSGDDVVVRQYDGKRTATGADISMQIQVRNLEAIAAIDQAIRESGWRPQFRRVVETQDPTYPFRLESTISYTAEP